MIEESVLKGFIKQVFFLKEKNREKLKMDLQEKEIIAAHMNLQKAIIRQAVRDVQSPMVTMKVKKDAYCWLKSEDFYMRLDLMADFYCFSAFLKKKKMDEFLEKWNKIYDIESAELSLDDEIFLD